MKLAQIGLVWTVWATIAIGLMAWKPGNLEFVAICLVLLFVAVFLTNKIGKGEF